MDISANVYDLQFLTNPNLINKISNEKRLGISPEDIKFYKKRNFETFYCPPGTGITPGTGTFKLKHLLPRTPLQYACDSQENMKNILFLVKWRHCRYRY